MDPNTQQQPIQNPTPPAQTRQIPVQNKKLLFIVGGAFLVLAIIIGVFMMRSPNSSNKPPVPSQLNLLLATVGEKQIFKNDVLRAATKQYSSDAINDEILNTFLERMIERAILDQEAIKLGITVTDNEIDTATGGSTDELEREQHKYNLLQTKIMDSQVTSAKVYVIGFWVRPLNDPHQLPIFAEQRREGSLALTEVRTRLRQGEKPVDVAKLTHEKYQSLKEIWALNGYLLDKPNDESVYQQPRLYTFDKEEMAALDDPEVFAAMQAMQAGEVRAVIRSDGSGGVVIQMVEKTPGEFPDYDTFLQARTKELVTIHNTL